MQAVVNMVMNLRDPLICMRCCGVGGGGRGPDSGADTLSGRAVTRQMCFSGNFRDFSFGGMYNISNFQRDTIYPEIPRVFPASLQETAGIVPRRITTVSFQFLPKSQRNDAIQFETPSLSYNIKQIRVPS
jgi:hypothetical protein